MNTVWKRWLMKENREDRDRILLLTVQKLIDLDIIRFRKDGDFVLYGNKIPEDKYMDECLYWTKNKGIL